MSATFKKAGEAVDGMRRQKCRACWWGAYMKDNVCVTRDERRPPAPALGAIRMAACVGRVTPRCLLPCRFVLFADGGPNVTGKRGPGSRPCVALGFFGDVEDRDKFDHCAAI